MTTAEHFDQAVSAYQGSLAIHPVDVATSNYFFYIGIPLNYTPIETKRLIVLIGPKFTLNLNQIQLNSGGGGGVKKSNIDQLADAMTQNYKDAHNNKEEILNPYDPNTNTGVPKECTERHNKRKKINYVMQKLEMPKFKNELTLDANGDQQ